MMISNGRILFLQGFFAPRMWILLKFQFTKHGKSPNGAGEKWWISNGKITNSTNPSHFWRLDWLFPVVETRQKGNLWAPTKRNYTYKKKVSEATIRKIPLEDAWQSKGYLPQMRRGTLGFPWYVSWSCWNENNDWNWQEKCGDSKCHPSSQKSCSSEKMDVSPCISNIWGFPKMVVPNNYWASY